MRCIVTADIKKLSDSLRRDTPEQVLERDIRRRSSELLADLQNGRPFEIRDPRGGIIRISPSVNRAEESSD